MPACDSRDIDCQETSKSREAIRVTGAATLALLVILVVSLVVYIMKRRKRLRKADRAIADLVKIDQYDPSHGLTEFEEEQETPVHHGG